MGLLQRIRSMLTRAPAPSSSEASANTTKLSDAAKTLAEQRGDNVSAQPAERGGYSTENVKNAARDLGPNIFNGPDAIGDVGENYRSSK